MGPLLIYIMGVSGSGKTTIGKNLAARTNLPFFDADDFHSEANKQKMKAGVPLTDADRAEWLKTISELARQQIKKDGAIIACSALKEKYRTVLSAGITVPLFWILLQGNYELIKRRMEARPNHYMPPALLSSQFDALEIPQNCVTMDIAKDPNEIVNEILSHIPHG